MEEAALRPVQEGLDELVGKVLAMCDCIRDLAEPRSAPADSRQPAALRTRPAPATARLLATRSRAASDTRV